MKQIVLYLLILLTCNLFGQKVDTIDLKSYYKDFVGGFSIYDLKTDEYIQYNPEHCKKRYSPCSTFKIPNSLIGLETGVIPDTGFITQIPQLKNFDMSKIFCNGFSSIFRQFLTKLQ